MASTNINNNTNTSSSYSHCIFKVAHLDSLDIDLVAETIAKEDFAVIRGLVDPQEVALSIAQLKTRFKKEDDHPTLGESPKDVQNNFQKLLIGGKMHSEVYCTRFFRVFYNPLWSEDIYKMHGIFRNLIGVRNALLRRPLDYATDKIESDGLWSACRIHQYPVGGGYFAGHKDVIVIDVAIEKKMPFFQVILVMTKQGVDFEQGGGYVKVRSGEVLNFEETFEVGDIVIYNETNWHGVEEVDPHRTLNLESVNGRLTAFVSLYKDKDKS